MGGIRLLIVDDHAVLSEAMGDALSSYGFEEVHVADHRDLTPDTVISQAERLRPELVLLDLFLGEDRQGLPLIKPLTELGSKVVVLSASRDRNLLAKCLDAGASGLLDKAMRFDELVSAIKRVAAGETLFDPMERAELLAAAESERRVQEKRMAPFNRLTASERAILCLLMAGSAPKQIARARSVSLATVRNQIHSILEKLDVSSERQAIALAHESGWPTEA